MSRSDAMAVLGCALVLTGCAPDRTRIHLDVPADARGRITDVEVVAWPAGGAPNACDVLYEWVAGTCGQDGCTGEPSFADLGASLGRAALTADAEGRLRGEIRLEQARPWTVTAIARLDDDTLLTGCVRVVTSGGEVTVALFHPWCAAPACDDSAVHPECRGSLHRVCDEPAG